MEPEQLEFDFPKRYYIGIYESPLRWSGKSVPITILEERDDLMRIRVERAYDPLIATGTILEVRSSGIAKVMGITPPEALLEERNWASSLWTLEGDYMGSGILGTKGKLDRRI